MLLISNAVLLAQDNPSLKPEAFKQMAASKKDAVVLDVRTPNEVKTGYIEGAMQLDYNAPDFKKKVGALDKSKTYLVYCASGVRSAKARDIMKDLGFSNVYHLKGGIEAWKSDGLPIKK